MRKKDIKKIKVMSNGYGHWLISMEYNNKTISKITNNSQAIDDYKCDEDERCEMDKRIFRKTKGYKILYKELTSK